MNSANKVVTCNVAEKIYQLEKQLFKVWEALSLREKRNIFLLNKFGSLRHRLVAMKEEAGIDTKGTINL